MNPELIEEFEAWYITHDVNETKDLEKVIRNGEYIYFFTTMKLLFAQYCEIKKLKEDNGNYVHVLEAHKKEIKEGAELLTEVF